MNIEQGVNRYLLFERFYNRFLLNELRNYINEKNNFDFNSVGAVYANIDKLNPQDKALVETFIETGKKSYLDIFSKLDLSKRNKIIKILNKAKSFFENVRSIDDESEEKYDQYFAMFKLVSEYLENKFQKEGLYLKEDKNEDCYIDFEEELNKRVNVKEDNSFKTYNKSKNKDKWSLNLPDNLINGDEQAA